MRMGGAHAHPAVRQWLFDHRHSEAGASGRLSRQRTCIAFLDRDGVINVDHGYVGSPADLDLIAGVPEALKLLRDRGYKLAVVTNQSGIARGYYTEADFRRVTAHLGELLAVHGVELDLVLHCPHGPGDDCPCRKPKPGMVLEGAQRLCGDLGRSVLFGDKASDIVAGRAAGVAQCFIVGASRVEADAVGADGFGVDLLACVHLLSADRLCEPRDTQEVK